MEQLCSIKTYRVFEGRSVNEVSGNFIAVWNWGRGGVRGRENNWGKSHPTAGLLPLLTCSVSCCCWSIGNKVQGYSKHSADFSIFVKIVLNYPCCCCCCFVLKLYSLWSFLESLGAGCCSPAQRLHQCYPQPLWCVPAVWFVSSVLCQFV